MSSDYLKYFGEAQSSERYVESRRMLHPAVPPSDAPYCPLPEVHPESNQWIPLTPVEQMAATEYDVLIVGSGAGGGAVLWRLADQWGNNEKKIGIVEAGDLFLPTHTLNIPTLNNLQRNQLLLNKFGFLGDKVPRFPGAMKKIVFGGSTLFWGNVTPRMAASAIMHWPVSLQEMDYYYSAAEAVMNVNTNLSKGSAFTDVMLGRLRQHGYLGATHRPMSVDLQPTQFGMLHSNVFFSSIIFFAYAFNRRPVDLAVNSRTVKVLVDRGRIVGVEVVTPDKKSYTIRAKKVVLSASTLETPRILLNSGIEGRAIGHYLTDHEATLAVGVVNRGDFPEVLGTLSILIPETDDTPFQFEISRNDKYYMYKYDVEPVLKEIDIFILGSCKTESRYENYLRLDPSRKDDYGVPEIQIHFSYSEADEQNIRRMIGMTRDIVLATGVTLSSPICRYLPGRERHYTGTCRIGNDPLTAAANPYGEIFGVSGLFVADNSMIPSVSAANPTLTTVALSIRTADHIVRQFQNKI